MMTRYTPSLKYKSMKAFLVMAFCFIVATIQAQSYEKYYSFPSGETFTEDVFNAFSQDDNFRKRLRFSVLDSIESRDSMIYLIALNDLTAQLEKFKVIAFNPYAKYDEFLGKRFEIENFQDETGTNFQANHLLDKPTLINFWFTGCTPCIREMPVLNQIKEELGTQANFVAITFDQQEAVIAFLQKKEFNFDHIYNASEPIRNMGVDAYPLSLILDKEGKIVHVEGDLFNVKEETTKMLKSML